MAVQVFDLVDESGTVRFRGTAVPPIGVSGVWAIYSGAALTLPDGETHSLPIDTLVDGTPLLDLSTPDAAKYLEPGTYAIAATVFATTPLTAGGIGGLFLTGAFHDVLNQDVQSSSTDPQRVGLGASIVAVATDEAGLGLSVAVANYDGVAARDYAVQALTIVKL